MIRGILAEEGGTIFYDNPDNTVRGRSDMPEAPGRLFSKPCDHSVLT